jgi:hypothetical protein
MIAFASEKKNLDTKRRPPRRLPKKQAKPCWHERYLKLLPDIRRQARMRVRYLASEAREEAIQEIVADTVVVYARLADLGKEDMAYATPLVNYAAAKFHAGRRVGNRLNVRDVTSHYCQRRKRIVVEQLDRRGDASGEWQEVLVEDRHATPADIAAIRIDFCDWLQTLSTRDRRIAQALATGETTSRVARAFTVTAGRVSQLRQVLRTSWYTFTREPDPAQVDLAGFSV